MDHPLTPTAIAALVAMIPVTAVLFLYLPLRRAVVTTFVLGWMFLPQAAIEVPGVLPDFDRINAIAGAVLFCAILFDFERLAAFRLRLLDAPLIALCAAPLLSSLANGLGAYDGLSSAMNRTLKWGIVYVLGRVYLSDWQGMKALAIGLFVGGLVYVPLCAFEMRMSPQLHNSLYGYHQHSFSQTFRLGGWRPTVFLQHGLAVGMWMAAASLMGSWLWLTGGLRRLGPVGFPLLLMLLTTTVFVRSMFAVALLLLGLSALGASLMWRRSWPIVLLSLVPFLYVGARVTGVWSGEATVGAVADAVNRDRAQSLAFRFENEDMLVERALQRPLFGWGGWARAHVHDPESGERLTVADGYWIIHLGENGFFGLIAFSLVFLLPVWVLLAHRPPGLWADLDVAPALGVAALLAVVMIDNLLNAMFNPLFVLAIGGLNGLLSSLVRLPRPSRSLRGVLTPEALLHIDHGALTAAARRRWGSAGLARRERLAAELRERQGIEGDEPSGLALRRLVLSMTPGQLEDFARLPAADQLLYLRASGALDAEQDAVEPDAGAAAGRPARRAGPQRGLLTRPQPGGGGAAQ